jgi:hypothetical protein
VANEKRVRAHTGLRKVVGSQYVGNLAPLEDFTLPIGYLWPDIQGTIYRAPTDWPLLTCFVGEAYPIPKNSPVSATAHTTSNLYSAGGTSGYPESSADANQMYPLMVCEEARNPYAASLTRHPP